MVTSLGHIWPWFPGENKRQLQRTLYCLFILPPFFIFFNLSWVSRDNYHVKSTDSNFDQEERRRNSRSVKCGLILKNYFSLFQMHIHNKIKLYIP